jgi:hypothetical protein
VGPLWSSTAEEKGSKRFTSHLRSLRKQDWDKRLAGVGELRRRSLVTLFTKMGGNRNGVGSVVQRGFGVAEEPHGACEQPSGVGWSRGVV